MIRAPRFAPILLSLCLVALIGLSPPLPGQAPVPPLPGQAPVPPLAGIAHVAMRVRDLSAARAFYESLGFEQAFDLRRDGVPYELFLKINDHQFIELYAPSEKTADAAFLHVCFESDDLRSLYDEYLTHGMTPTAVSTSATGNLLFAMAGPAQPLTDTTAMPGKQTIEYTQYMPGSLHSNDAGKHLGADRIADRLLSVSLAVADPVSGREFYLNQLSFKPLPGEPMVLHLPGHSGDQVEIAQPTLGARARFTLQAANLGRVGRRLGHEHIRFVKTAEMLTFNDPDGNQILVQQR